MHPPTRTWLPVVGEAGTVRTDCEAYADDGSAWAAVVGLDPGDGSITAAVVAADTSATGAVAAEVVVTRPSVYDYDEEDHVGVTETMWACDVVLCRIEAHGLVPTAGDRITVCLCCGDTTSQG